MNKPRPPYARIARIAMALGASTVLALQGAGGDERTITRGAMKEVFASYQHLLELSANDQALQAPVNRDTLISAASRLSEAAASVTEHASRDDTVVLADSLDRYGAWIERALREREFDWAQMLIYQASELCIACHTRLPESSDSPRAEQFVASNFIKELPAFQRARLQVATRRFSDAMTSFEAAFADPDLDSENAYAHYEVLVPYLSVALAATDNATRAKAFLRRQAGNVELRPPLRKDLQTWARAIEGFPGQVAGMSKLAAARALVTLAQAATPEADDRWPGLAHYVLAAAQLQGYLQTAGPAETPELAQAYYLLGLVTYETATVDWLPHAELYLENAIMIAPHTPLAERAYDLLEARLLESLDVEMTPEIDAHLAYLRELAKAPGG